MSWNVALLKNDFIVPEALKSEVARLYAKRQDCELDEALEYAFEGNKLNLDLEHMEHIDWVAGDVFDYIKANYDGVQVYDILFADTESVEQGDFWGYRFGGGKGMSHKLKGKLIWSVA